MCKKKDYLTFICVQVLQISRYLPVQCAKGAEFASFTVQLWSSLGLTPSLLVMGVDSANFT